MLLLLNACPIVSPRLLDLGVRPSRQLRRVADILTGPALSLRRKAGSQKDAQCRIRVCILRYMADMMICQVDRYTYPRPRVGSKSRE